MEDVPEPGHYISVQAGLNNIFIVMGRDRRLRAFHNICRHRGTQLIRPWARPRRPSPVRITTGPTISRAT